MTPLRKWDLAFFSRSASVWALRLASALAVSPAHFSRRRAVTLPVWTNRVPHTFVIASLRRSGDVKAIPAGLGTRSLVFLVFPIVPAGLWDPFVIAREKFARVESFIVLYTSR